MPITLNGDTGIITPMYNGSITANAVTPVTGFKNRIINGGMTIAQRGTSSADPASNQYFIDRWVTGLNVTGKISIAQSSVAPAGFTSSFLVTSSSAYTVQPSDIIYLQQRIEGFNTADLAFGTASAKSLAMSFWVRSSLTGTFSGFLQNANETRIYAFTYTIASANTWQQVTVSIPGDTSGTWVGATNDIGMRVSFSICAGSSYLTTANSWNSATAFGVAGQTNLVATNGATWQVTGCQLEVGSSATSFDFRPYNVEFDMCRRYCEVWGSSAGTTILTLVGPNPNNNSQIAGAFTCYAKRVAPTMTFSSASTYRINWQGGDATPQSVDFGGNVTLNINAVISSSSNPGAYASRLFLTQGSVSTNYLIASAEL
jgi:hypothetical protein